MKQTDIYYQAYKNKDPLFDGQFFIGVKTTHIYCRPVCTARMPKQKNCCFFLTALEAEKANFRPCLRCRPDLNPGLAIVDITKQLADKAKYYIEQGLLKNGTMDMLAKKLGITNRHLRRVFVYNFGMTPLQFEKQQQLVYARQLLMESHLSITDIALAADFRSVRQFNYAFKNYYKLTPSQCRK